MMSSLHFGDWSLRFGDSLVTELSLPLFLLACSILVFTCFCEWGTVTLRDAWVRGIHFSLFAFPGLYGMIVPRSVHSKRGAVYEY